MAPPPSAAVSPTRWVSSCLCAPGSPRHEQSAPDDRIGCQCGHYRYRARALAHDGARISERTVYKQQKTVSVWRPGTACDAPVDRHQHRGAHSDCDQRFLLRVTRFVPAPGRGQSLCLLRARGDLPAGSRRSPALALHERGRISESACAGQWPRGRRIHPVLGESSLAGSSVRGAARLPTGRRSGQ